MSFPGNDDAMRAILLYAGGVADSVLEGKASLPQVPVGEDEFVELDEEGNPKKRATAAAVRRRPRRAARSRRRAARCRSRSSRALRAAVAQLDEVETKATTSMPRHAAGRARPGQRSARRPGAGARPARGA
jgi:small subunit ribosomal protein S2